MQKFSRYSTEDGDGIAARTLPGRAPEGRVLHARLGPQQARRLHRDPRRVPGGRGPPRAQARRRRPRRCRAPIIQHAAGATIGIVTVGGCDAACARRSTMLASAGHRGRLHARPRLPVRRRRSRRSSTRTSATSSSSRTATRSCARCSTLETGVAQARSCTSVLDYGGLPARAPRHVRRRGSAQARSSVRGRRRDHDVDHEADGHPPERCSRTRSA